MATATGAAFRIAAVWVLMCALLCVCAGGASQTPEPIRVESALVSVPVVVNNARGKPVPGLAPEAFTLYEDGAPIPISLFHSSEDPVRIALLIDTSISTTTVLKKIKKAAGGFLLQLRPQDSAAVISFDDEIQLLSPFTSDETELRQAIHDAGNRGGSYSKMRDAVLDAVQRRFRSVAGRKAIILLTDGQDQGSAVSPPDLVDAVAASGVLVYAVYYTVDYRQLVKELFGVRSRMPRDVAGKRDGGSEYWRNREDEAARNLEYLCDISAGTFFRSDVARLDEAFHQIAAELRSQYLLGFYPDQSKLDGLRRTLEVRVAVPDVVTRSRTSYRSGRQSEADRPK